MAYLLDTKVFSRLYDTSSSLRPVAMQAINRLRAGGETLHYTPQNLIEFWAVATRPDTENGLGLTIVDAVHSLVDIKSLYKELQDTSDLISEWERLVSAHSVIGKQVHDTRLVAVMLVHKVDRILTFNTKHFSRFTEITAVDPANV